MIHPPSPSPSSEQASKSVHPADLHPPEILEALIRLADLTNTCNLTASQQSQHRQNSRADLVKVLTYMGVARVELTLARSALAAERAASAEMHARWRASQRELGETREIAHESARLIAQKDEQIDQLRAALADRMSRASDQEIARVRHGLDGILPAHRTEPDPANSHQDIHAGEIKHAYRFGCDMPTPAGRCGIRIAGLTNVSPSFRYCDHHLKILREGTTPEESQHLESQPPGASTIDSMLEDVFSGVVELTAREHARLSGTHRS